MTEVEKIATVKDLIKSYQEEIDTLTKRARASDGAFFALYKSLYEAPDPAEALRQAASARPRAAASELEITKLRGEVAAYEAEFKELKNQDITIRKLEEQLEDFEESLEGRVSEQVEVAQAEAEAVAQRRVEEVLEREAALEHKLGQAQTALAEARAGTDRLQTKLFEAAQRAEALEQVPPLPHAAALSGAACPSREALLPTRPLQRSRRSWPRPRTSTGRRWRR